jgi:hypothetical protein
MKNELSPEIGRFIVVARFAWTIQEIVLAPKIPPNRAKRIGNRISNSPDEVICIDALLFGGWRSTHPEASRGREGVLAISTERIPCSGCYPMCGSSKALPSSPVPTAQCLPARSAAACDSPNSEDRTISFCPMDSPPISCRDILRTPQRSRIR